MGLISYYDAGAGDLKVAHCANVVCSEANSITVVDSGGEVGRASSLYWE